MQCSTLTIISTKSTEINSTLANLLQKIMASQKTNYVHLKGLVAELPTNLTRGLSGRPDSGVLQLSTQSTADRTAYHDIIFCNHIAKFMLPKPAVGNSPLFWDGSPTGLGNVILIWMQSPGRYCS